MVLPIGDNNTKSTKGPESWLWLWLIPGLVIVELALYLYARDFATVYRLLLGVAIFVIFCVIVTLVNVAALAPLLLLLSRLVKPQAPENGTGDAVWVHGPRNYKKALAAEESARLKELGKRIEAEQDSAAKERIRQEMGELKAEYQRKREAISQSLFFRG